MSKMIDGTLPISEKRAFYNAKPILALGAVCATGSIFTKTAYKSFARDTESYTFKERTYCNTYIDKALSILNNSKPKYKIIDMSTSDNSNIKMLDSHVDKRKLIEQTNQNSCDLESLKKQLKFPFKNKVFNDIGNCSKGKNAYALPNSGLAFVNRKICPHLSFHELGHLKLSNKIKKLGAIEALLLPICLFYAISKKSDNINKDKKDFGDFVKKHCVGLTILSQIPKLLDEGLASILGIKLAKNAGMNNKNILNKIKISYSKGYLTYLLSALTIIGSIYAASKVKDSM